jgi:hypothetical protein
MDLPLVGGVVAVLNGDATKRKEAELLRGAFREQFAAVGTQFHQLAVIVGGSIVDAFVRLWFVLSALTGPPPVGLCKEDRRSATTRKHIRMEQYIRNHNGDLWPACQDALKSKHRLVVGAQTSRGQPVWDLKRRQTYLSKELLDQINHKIELHTSALFDLRSTTSWFVNLASPEDKRYVQFIRESFLAHLQLDPTVHTVTRAGVDGDPQWWLKVVEVRNDDVPVDAAVPLRGVPVLLSEGDLLQQLRNASAPLPTRPPPPPTPPAVALV